MGPPEKLDADLGRSLVIGGVCVIGALGMLFGHARAARRPAPAPVGLASAATNSPPASASPVAVAPRRNDIQPVDLSGKGAPPGGGGHYHAPVIKHVSSAVVPPNRLPVDVVNRIVRQNYGRFRLCYEAGLRTQPTLHGRIGVKFVIDRSGAVTQAFEDGPSTTLAHRDVVACVARGFRFLSFPAPDNGIATVVYWIDFTP